MKLTIENTTQIVELNGVPARVWEGQTESGIKVHCFVTRISVNEDDGMEVHEKFRKELSECKKPSVVFPLKMVL